MTKRYSIAEARANLPTIVDEVEAGGQIELTRRGKPVAVVVSRPTYERLTADGKPFADAYRAFLTRAARRDSVAAQWAAERLQMLGGK